MNTDLHHPGVDDRRPVHHVLLVDDHVLFRSGMHLLLSRHPQLRLAIAEASSVADALQCLRQSAGPDLILLDIHLPGLNGLEGLRLLRKEAPYSRIAMLSGRVERAVIEDALSRGADGFLRKDAEPDEAHQAVLALLQGQRHFPMLDVGRVHHVADVGAGRANVLTPRQMEVLGLLAQGMVNKVIARRLGLSENTVRVHVSALLSLLGCNTRLEAVHEARRRGWLTE